MKKNTFIKNAVWFFLFVLFTARSAESQKKNFDYTFYGFVRGDVYYNSRSNIEVVDGLFYLYPKDFVADADGKDLNATSNGNFYTFTSRLGMDIKGPDVGKAKTSAKIESDFGGTTNINFMLRLRQAYVKFDWKKGSTVLLGQTWHPLFGEVVPNVMNLSTGCPFQPFNRSPLVNYQYRRGGLKLTASAIYQLVYVSSGPAGRSEEYLKNGVLPELYAGIDYRNNNLKFGAGVDMLSINPRIHSEINGRLFRVHERLTTISYDLHAEFTNRKFHIAGKTLLDSNQGHNTMIGGYGVANIDPRTGKQDYTAFRNSTSWVNLVYGTKYQCGLFAGYTKNLGTSDKLINTSNLYGMGMDIDQFTQASLFVRYNLPHWNIGLEYALSTARYGEISLANGKVGNTHDISNHRIESVFIYTF